MDALLHSTAPADEPDTLTISMAASRGYDCTNHCTTSRWPLTTALVQHRELTRSAAHVHQLVMALAAARSSPGVTFCRSASQHCGGMHQHVHSTKVKGGARGGMAKRRVHPLSEGDARLATMWGTKPRVFT